MISGNFLKRNCRIYISVNSAIWFFHMDILQLYLTVPLSILRLTRLQNGQNFHNTVFCYFLRFLFMYFLLGLLSGSIIFISINTTATPGKLSRNHPNAIKRNVDNMLFISILSVIIGFLSNTGLIVYQPCWLFFQKYSHKWVDFFSVMCYNIINQ